MHMTRHVPFALTQVSAYEYTGTVQADGLLDEDYYKRGICHWQLTQVQVHMKATGADGETLFAPSIDADSLLSQQTTNLYFWRKEYPRSSMENYPDFGESSREKFRPELQDQLFMIALSSKKELP